MPQCNEAETKPLDEDIYFCVRELGHVGRHRFAAKVPLKKPHPRYGYGEAREEKK